MVHVDHYLTSHPLTAPALTFTFEQAGIPIASAPLMRLEGALAGSEIENILDSIVSRGIISDTYFNHEAAQTETVQ
jgi:hypothetical protein